MTEWGDNIIIGNEVEASAGKIHTREFLKHLKLVTGTLLYKAPLSDYKIKLRRSKASESHLHQGPPYPPSTMEKMEVLDPELRVSGWRRFNFPWCTI